MPFRSSSKYDIPALIKLSKGVNGRRGCDLEICGTQKFSEKVSLIKSPLDKVTHFLVLRTVLNTAPGFVASKFVPNLIPRWVDDEFMAEFRNVLLLVVISF